MSVSPSLSPLHAKRKGVAVTAVLLMLLFATLPFSVPHATADAVSSAQDNYPIMSSIHEENNVQTAVAVKLLPSLVGVGQVTWITATVTPLPPTPNDRLNGLRISIMEQDGMLLTDIR
jgi:hypothetical protein